MTNAPPTPVKNPGICLIGLSGTILHMDKRFSGVLGLAEPAIGVPFTELFLVPELIDKAEGMPPPLARLRPDWTWAVHATVPDAPTTVYIRPRILMSGNPPQPLDLPLNEESVSISSIPGSDVWPESPALCLYCDFDYSYGVQWSRQAGLMVLRDFSHRFGNIISSIQGFAEIIRQRLPDGGGDPFALRALNNIFRGCDQIKDIILDTQVISSRAPLEKTPLDLAACVEAGCAEFTKVRPPSFRLHLAEKPAEPILFQLDPKRVKELLNDIWAMFVHTCAHEPTMSPSATEHSLYISIDHGAPVRRKFLPPADITHGRLRFELLHKSVSLKFITNKPESPLPPEGDSPTVYDRSRVAGIIKAHGGFFEYVSGSGVGFILDVYLPLHLPL